MALDRAEVEHIAVLARIGLTEEEIETFREQLSNILEQFERLKELDTRSVTPPAMRWIWIRLCATT